MIYHICYITQYDILHNTIYYTILILQLHITTNSLIEGVVVIVIVVTPDVGVGVIVGVAPVIVIIVAPLVVIVVLGVGGATVVGAGSPGGLLFRRDLLQ
jgi:hypothetical protein